MKIKKIVIDVDDVCNDFTLTALKLIGCGVIKHSRDFSAYNTDWKFDILKAANALHPNKTFTLTSFWDHFESNDWADMPESEEFRPLLVMARKAVGKKNILISTSPICGKDISCKATTECMTGKYIWIREQRSFSIGPAKHFAADSETLLIDDCCENVKDFRRAGGKAILMPRPWNIAYCEDPLLFIQEEFLYYSFGR